MCTVVCRVNEEHHKKPTQCIANKRFSWHGLPPSIFPSPPGCSGCVIIVHLWSSLPLHRPAATLTHPPTWHFLSYAALRVFCFPPSAEGRTSRAELEAQTATPTQPSSVRIGLYNGAVAVLFAGVSPTISAAARFARDSTAFLSVVLPPSVCVCVCGCLLEQIKIKIVNKFN